MPELIGPEYRCTFSPLVTRKKRLGRLRKMLKHYVALQGFNINDFSTWLIVMYYSIFFMNVMFLYLDIYVSLTNYGTLLSHNISLATQAPYCRTA